MAPGPMAQVKIGAWLLYVRHVVLGAETRAVFAERLTAEIMSALRAAAFGNEALAAAYLAAFMAYSVSRRFG